MTQIQGITFQYSQVGATLLDNTAEAAEVVTYELVLKNGTTETAVYVIDAPLPAPFIVAANTAVVTTLSAGTTDVGTSPAALPFTSEVSVPSGGQVKYAVSVTVPAATVAPVGAHITAAARATLKDGAVRAQPVVLETSAETKVITAAGVVDIPEEIFLIDGEGHRSVDQHQLVYKFFAGDNEADAQFLQDAVTAGWTLASVIRKLTLP